MFDKTIQMYIFDGNPNGRIMCELSNWNGRVYKVSRNDIAGFSKRQDSQFTGVYFLFGKDDENNDTIYVGEAEDVLKRLKQHLSEKEYWYDCVSVISKDNILNKAHVKYLESCFFELAKNSGRFILLNNNIPTRSSISEYDEAMLKEFISNAKLLVNALGYKAFETIEDTAVKRLNNNIVFSIIAARGADAKGYIVADGFAVLKDSVIASSTVRSMPPSLVKLRSDLINRGIVDTSFKLTKDYVFTSPSQAASIVMGRSANGRTEWKTNDGMVLDVVERQNFEI